MSRFTKTGHLTKKMRTIAKQLSLFLNGNGMPWRDNVNCTDKQSIFKPKQDS